jgi:hypothetical protein
VTGAAKDTYKTFNDTVVVPVNSTKWTSIEAIIDQNGQAVSRPGSIAADGTLIIPDVPQGPYWLVLTSPPAPAIPGAPGFKRYIATSSRTLDLGSLYSYRMDVEDITQPTLVELNAALTEPWQAYMEDDQGNVVQYLDDYLQIISFGADVASTVFATSGTAEGPANGDTALIDWQLDASEVFFSSSGRPHLIRTDLKDDVAVLHSVTTEVTSGVPSPTPDAWESYTYSAVKEAYNPAPVVMSNGSTTLLNGGFQPLAQKTFSLDYKGSQWNKALTDAPTADLSIAFLQIGIFVEPQAPEVAYGTSATLFDIFVSGSKTWADLQCNPDACDPAACPSGCNPAEMLYLPGDHAHEYAYGNPFSAGQELAFATLTFRRDVTQLLPGDSTPERLIGSISVRMPVQQVSGAPLAPLLGLPRNVTVNGKATPVDMVTAVGNTPEIAFEAPTLGTPESYSARVIALDDVKNGSGTVLRRNYGVASFAFTGTSVKIPDGILQPGKHYYVQVSALATGVDLSSPFYVKPSNVVATTFTGVITP